MFALFIVTTTNDEFHEPNLCFIICVADLNVFTKITDFHFPLVEPMWKNTEQKPGDKPTGSSDKALADPGGPLQLPNLLSPHSANPSKVYMGRSRGICISRDRRAVGGNPIAPLPTLIPNHQIKLFLWASWESSSEGSSRRGGRGDKAGRNVGTFDMKWTKCQDPRIVRHLQGLPVHTWALA